MAEDRMSIFDYRPQVKYELERLESIDNTSNYNEESYVASYENNLSYLIKEAIQSDLTQIRRYKEEALSKLKGTKVRFNPERLDDISREALERYSSKEELLEGQISFEVYRECKNDPSMSQIVNEWENQQDDIDGTAEGEALPYIITIEEDLGLLDDFINKVTIYDKDINNLEKEEKEQVEELKGLIRELDNEYKAESPNPKRISEIKKRRFLMERRLDFNKNVVSIIRDYSRELQPLFRTLESLLASTNNNNSSINRISSRGAARLTAFQSFRGKRQKLYAKKQEYLNLHNTSVKVVSYKTAITNSRLYINVAIPILNDLDSILEIDNGLEQMVDGVEDIVNLCFESIINLKGILKSATRNIGEQLNLVHKKHGSRVLYNSIK